MDWKKVEHSKNRIKLAGNAISKNNFAKISKEESLTIINNWRAAHAFPLQIFYVNCRTKAKHFPNAVAVQRLKRLDSIVGKLQRTPDMSLTRMQDLGGCRMITDSISDVYRVADEFKNSRIRHTLVREYDYIARPKKSGYRSIHLVYSYNSDKKADYNGMLIEVQIRTQLQHLWATAIEVLGLYTKYNLKASQGDEKILRYMELVSALFAIEERTAISDNVPSDKEAILAEIDTLKETNVLHILSEIRTFLDYKSKKQETNREGYYILAMDVNTKVLSVFPYRKSEIHVATKVYEEIENSDADENVNAVLVSASSINTLIKAYPNYFVDVKSFVDKVKEILL